MDSSPDRALTIERQSDADRVSLRLSGELDAHTAPDLDLALGTAIAEGATVEIDLSDVSFVDSSGLAALLDGRSRLEDAGGGLRVVTLSAAAERLFTMTGVRSHLLGPDS